MKSGIPIKVLVSLVLLPVLAFAMQPAGPDLTAVRQWTAAPFWTPPTAAQSAGGTSAGPNAAVVGTAPLPFIAVASCRLFDSRAGSGGLALILDKPLRIV